VQATSAGVLPGNAYPDAVSVAHIHHMLLWSAILGLQVGHTRIPALTMLRFISRWRSPMEAIADHGAALLEISTKTVCQACCSCSSEPNPSSQQMPARRASARQPCGLRFLNTITDISAAREQSSIAVFDT
jgi:hypothetical protein